MFRSVDILATSSQEYIDNYFHPLQNYRKRYYILENKLYFNKQVPPRPQSTAYVKVPRLRIGLVGLIRCQVSFDLFLEIADKLQQDVEIHLYGYFAEPIKNRSEIDGRENIKYFGRYEYPADLERIYTNLDLVWVSDFRQRGNNSDWALANRLYEAGYFGCAALAVKDTANARFIAAKGSGFIVNAPTEAAVSPLLRRLNAVGMADTRREILACDASNFVQTQEEIRGLIRMVARTDHEA